jgi:hypothetical protein
MHSQSMQQNVYKIALWHALIRHAQNQLQEKQATLLTWTLNVIVTWSVKPIWTLNHHVTSNGYCDGSCSCCDYCVGYETYNKLNTMQKKKKHTITGKNGRTPRSLLRTRWEVRNM